VPQHLVITPGTVVRKGTGVPPNSLGQNDDIFIDVNTGRVSIRVGGAYVSVQPGVTHGLFATGPPASPVDGDLWVADYDGSGSIVWTFRYNAGSGSTFKWEFQGGGTYVSTAQTSVYTAIPNGWAAEAPIIVPARAGDWDIVVGAQFTCPTVGSYVSLYVGTTAAVGGGNAMSEAVANGHFSLQTVQTITGNAAGQQISLWVFASVAGFSYANAWMRAKPVRVS
jgi:hypothetical protein